MTWRSREDKLAARREVGVWKLAKGNGQATRVGAIVLPARNASPLRRLGCRGADSGAPSGVFGRASYHADVNHRRELGLGIAVLTAVALLVAKWGFVDESAPPSAPPSADSLAVAPAGPQVTDAVEAAGPASIASREFVTSVTASLARELQERRELVAPPVLPPIPSESSLLQASPERLIDHTFFQAVYAEEIRSQPAFVGAFRAALINLRAQRTSLYVERDTATGEGVSALLRGGFRPLSRPKASGELGAIVGGVDKSGWVPVPREHAAYKLQEQLDAWPASAIDMLTHLKW